MDWNPATNPSAVPAARSPPMSPTTTPIAKNSAAIWSNPQPKRSTPTTSRTNVASTTARATPWRIPSPSPGSAPPGASPGGAARVRVAWRTVPQIHTASAGTRKPMRNTDPERSGSWASCWAIPTWNGLIGLNDAPTAAAPRLAATAVTRSKPSRRTSSSMTGTSAMISSFMLSSTPPTANATHAAGMTSASRPLSRRTSQSTAPRRAPVRSTTVNAPPIRNTKKITDAASTMPLGMATRAWSGPTGCGSTA